MIDHIINYTIHLNWPLLLILIIIIISCASYLIRNSPINIKLRKLAQFYNCFTVPSYKCNFQMKSKNAYDNFNLERRLNPKYINNINDMIKETDYIEKRYKRYRNAAFNIIKHAKWYQKIGYKHYLRNLHDRTWIIIVTYTSPKGRNHYRKVYQNTIYQAIPNYINNLCNSHKYLNKYDISKTQVKNERSKLTASLRYRVLKHDHYRCVICGRSAKDGIKLHVDHIKPVSRGGKTELNNLRTLCSDCNLGKSNKYDPNYTYAK